MASPKEPEPVYYCAHCGEETSHKEFRIRERIQRDHADPFECIRYLRDRIENTANPPLPWDD